MAKIRVFDPACGSGNFLDIAYKEMRAMEAEINKRRSEPDRASEIPLTNFRGIELRDFPAEIARLALVITEYQCDVLYRGQKLALAEFLPLPLLALPAFAFVEAFDPALNPIRAKVSLSLRVLSVDDLGFASKGGALIAILKAGTRLTVLEPAKKAKGKIGKPNQWLHVRGPNNNQRGYVSAEYVTLP